MKRVSHSEAWTGLADCRNCAIRKTVLFAGLEEADFDRIHRPIDQLVYQPGMEIYRQDDPANAILTIRKGLVKLVQYLPDGTQRIVRLLCSTDNAGLEALLTDSYEHTAIALQPTEICRIPVDTINELSTSKPQLYRDLMERWHQALGVADRWIIEFCTGSARARVARLLIWMCERNGGNRCMLFGREDLGALLGLTTETVSRIMAEFKRKRLISEPKPNELICRIEDLQALVS